MSNKDWFTKGWNGEPGPSSGFINLMDWQRGKVKYELARLKATDREKWRRLMNFHVKLYNILYTTIITVVCAVGMGYFFGTGVGIVSFLFALGICIWVADAERKSAERKWQEKLRKEKDQAEERVKIAETIRQEHIASIAKYKEMHEKNNYAIMPDNDLIKSLHTKKLPARNVKPTLILLIVLVIFALTVIILGS